MLSLIFLLALASLPDGDGEKTQPAPPAIDPKFEIVPGPFKRVVPSDRDSGFKLHEHEGRCYFIATRPVNPAPDQAIVRDIPSAPPIDNMPVVKPGPTCSTVR
jgi:hypothetical protein